ncbi:MAG: hypothetical protein FJZ59_06460 [Chlamydiae bacterium]|jgi:NACalpha-BTF3-like transcription factor|nr:hypothetical protein [Chlamydiota bacterium]
MQPFMKMKKKIGMTESTRQVLNRAIDLLHRLSNKKLSEESARKELNTTLSQHFLSEGGVEAQKKIKLQMILEEANDVVTELDKGKIPLYEAIMLVNRIVSNGVNKEPPPLPDNRITSANAIEPFDNRPKITPYEDDAEFVSQEFDVSGDQREKNLQMKISQKIQEKIEEAPPKQSEDDVALLMNRVLMNKKELENAISDLNGTLQSVGFELRPIEK